MAPHLNHPDHYNRTQATLSSSCKRRYRKRFTHTYVMPHLVQVQADQGPLTDPAGLLGLLRAFKVCICLQPWVLRVSFPLL